MDEKQFAQRLLKIIQENNNNPKNKKIEIKGKFPNETNKEQHTFIIIINGKHEDLYYYPKFEKKVKRTNDGKFYTEEDYLTFFNDLLINLNK